tara:strand:- start:94 stop:624 length:531 start_codon:yes stop_codon:yes gene_type:complete
MIKFLVSVYLILSFSSLSQALEIIKVELNNDYNRTTVWTGNFIDYSGHQWDVSNYYDNKIESFHAGIFLSHEINGIDFTSKLYLDNGYDSTLYNVKPLAYISIAADYQYSENKSFKLMLDPIIQYGGSVSESPCFDDFRRAYHCGTGLNWTDAISGNHLRTYDLESFIKIKFKFDF